MGLVRDLNSGFTFVDLFAGLGGFHQAATALGGKCVFASEIEDRLRDLYLKNFGILPDGDIRAVDIRKIPAHDVLFAGFPCQPFSKAGKQMGWEDAARGTLFGNIVAIARMHKPKIILMENVAHFVRHDSGETYLKVQVALRSAGYEVTHKQLSPHNFSVPHIRERIYLLATRQPLLGFSWPKPHDSPNLDIADVLDTNPADATKISPRVRNCLAIWQEFLDIIPSETKLPSFPLWSMEAFANYPISRKNLNSFSAERLGRFRGAFGKSLSGLSKKEQLSFLPPYARGTDDVFPRWKREFIRQNREFWKANASLLKNWFPKIKQFPPSLQKFEWNCQGEPRNIRELIVQFRASGVRVKRRNTSPSLVAMTTTQIPIIPWEDRYMTVRECARLQSMDALEHLPAGATAMSALGNAVNVKVVKGILAQVLCTTILLQ
jgi:DNA (cytosine-5)-methyltransferase 1